MGNSITTIQPQTDAEWLEQRSQLRSQIAQLDSQTELRRNAEIIAILEVASRKIDRFGWDRMDRNVKDQLCADWLDRLGHYMLAEIRAGVDAVFVEKKGNVKSLNEFQVEAKIIEAHSRQRAGLPRHVPEPDRDRSEGQLSPEDRAEHEALLDEFVFRLKSGKPQTQQQTLDNINAAKDMLEGEQ